MRDQQPRLRLAERAPMRSSARGQDTAATNQERLR